MFSGLCLFSQDIKFKKGVISIDGTPCLNHDRVNNTITFYDLKGEELMSLNYMQGGPNGSYARIVFVKEKLKVTSSGLLYVKTDFIKHLVRSGAFSNCVINREKLDSFILKFDENLDR
jgi:hypothetical protein